MNHQEIAEILDQAAQNLQPTPQLAAKHEVNLETAYEIQNLCMQKTLEPW